jgi:hypothetical protein
MKHASAYLRKGKIFLSPFSKTTKGFLIRWEPIVLTSEDDAELGRKVLWVLSQSTVNVPHPESWMGRSDLMAKAAGVRSYEAFADLAKCVGIAQNDDGVVLTPSKNGGPRKRFLFLKNKIRCQPIEEEVTQALKTAFDACE